MDVKTHSTMFTSQGANPARNERLNPQRCRIMAPQGAQLLLPFVVYLACTITPAFSIETIPTRDFSIGDYFKINRVLELSLSSDGGMVAYRVEFPSIEQNNFVEKVYICSTTARAEPIIFDKIQQARNLAWIPGTHELAYIQSDGDISHVYSLSTTDGSIHQHTRGSESVLQFRFAPNGETLAWLSRSDSEFVSSEFEQYQRSTLYERLFRGDKGVVIDSENTSATYFVNPERLDVTAENPNSLWIKETDEQVSLVKVPGQVKDFHWSSNSTSLSIVYSGDDLPRKHLFDRYTSLGIFDVVAESFQTLAHGLDPTRAEKAIYYAGGEWIPNSDKLIIRRTTEDNRWKHTAEWALFDLSTQDKSLESQKRQWNEVELFYGLTTWGPPPALMPISETKILSNHAFRARRGLYEIKPTGIKKSDLLSSVAGSVSFVRSSASFGTVAFVNESLNHPPEIYIWQRGLGVKKLTALNEEIAKLRLPKAREVIWRSTDGVAVQGWLLEPIGKKSRKKPWPLVTFVHGGPSLPFLDEFAYYFKAGGTSGGIWPYPFELYALNGMAVFIPNYRGTKTFGAEFFRPSALDGEPIQDIVSGIEFLVSKGIANPEQLAISGQSHGAWLGSLVMTRFKLFRAASFAEGAQNRVVSYELNSGFINKHVSDVQYGVSLYDDPVRYIGLSSDLHFKGLDTAVLFEAGAKVNALRMLGSPKAALRAGMPSELVVYPKTGHNIRIPQLKLESAARNLDWFRFWLLNKEVTNSEKEEQYTRWRRMRDERCAQNATEQPYYCSTE